MIRGWSLGGEERFSESLATFFQKSIDLGSRLVREILLSKGSKGIKKKNWNFQGRRGSEKR